MNRRKSREMATRLLFEMLINKESYVDIIENFRENTDEKIEDIDFEYLIRVLRGVSENEAYINETISKYLIKWKIERLPKMNLAILKMATYEILFEEEIPNKATINEAIEPPSSPTIIDTSLGGLFPSCVLFLINSLISSLCWTAKSLPLNFVPINTPTS